MQVKVITAFNDMTIADANERRREIGAEFEAEDMRAAQLAVLGFVEIIGPAETAASPVAPAAAGAAAADANELPAPSAPTAPVVALP